MNNFFGILATVLAANFAQAADVKLTKACEEQLKRKILNVETKYLTEQGEHLAGNLEAHVSLSYYPNKPTVTVSVSLKDSLDGRSVNYAATVPKSEAAQCNLFLERRTQRACRYSHFEGLDGLASISGISYKEVKILKKSRASDRA